MKLKVQLITVVFIFLFSITCFSANIQNLTNQTNVKGIFMWCNDTEFYYYSKDKEWFIYNIESKTYRKIPRPETSWELSNSDINNSIVEINFTDDGKTLAIQNKSNKITKYIQLDKNFCTDIVSVPRNGKYIGLCTSALLEDAYKWMMLDVKNLDLITIPMNQNEYGGGTTAWSNDNKFVAFDILKIEGVDRAEADVSHCGLLVFDIENKKVIFRHLQVTTDYWLVTEFKYPEILFLNEKRQLCICNIKTNKISIIYEGKLDNALWGRNEEVYAVINGKLAKISY